ncbi:MAG: hypothetical protein NW206_02845 [Hyphomonadaceae bacterium]|nr:hypothetical protein [Hyphomonadaceae bacterium]
MAGMPLPDVETAVRQFECGFCPDCGFTLPARQRSAGVVRCSHCDAVWSIEHKPEPRQ